MIFILWNIMINGQIIELTRAENIILNLLIENKKIVTTYSELSLCLFAREINEYDYKNIIKVMERLRKKLKGILNIYTKQKVGYCLYEYW